MKVSELTWLYPLLTESFFPACPVHAVFHGCLQSYSIVGYEFILHSGYNEWAEANNLIVLYPQAVRSAFLPTNPEACWDWFDPFVSVLISFSMKKLHFHYSYSSKISSLQLNVS